MIGVGEHLVTLFVMCSPEAVIGFDAGIRGSLRIAEVIAKSNSFFSRNSFWRVAYCCITVVLSRVPSKSKSNVL